MSGRRPALQVPLSVVRLIVVAGSGLLLAGHERRARTSPALWEPIVID